MKSVMLVVFLLCSGCATLAPQPESNPWDSFQAPTAKPTFPVETPEFPRMDRSGSDKLAFVDEQGNVLATFDAKLAKTFAQIQTVAKGNEDIARANAQALQEADASITAVVQMGKAEHDVSDSLRRQLHDERRGRLWDKIQYIGFIAAGLALGLSR